MLLSLISIVVLFFFYVGLKPTIIKRLEAYRDDELSERREKRRKLQDKNGDKAGDAALTADGESPSNDQNDTRTSMEVRYAFMCLQF